VEQINRVVISAAIVLANYRVLAATKEVVFSQSANSVAVYDYVEVSLRVTPPIVGNPFTDVVVTGSFSLADGSGTVNVDGFCDSPDGSLFRIPCGQRITRRESKT